MATNGSAVEQNEPVNANGKVRVIPAGIIGPLESDVVALLEALQVPFDTGLVKWRANETKFVDRKLQGFCLPYADPRAYKDRLNILLSPIKWRDRYAITTTAAKILVTCELQIDCLGCHSATGEEWSRNENATTAAEAQAFKRACSGFGLGRYFYHFSGVWLPLDQQKRPTSNPQLPAWATPDGWKGGLRPPINVVTEPQPKTAPDTALNSPEREAAGATEPTRPTKNVVQELRAMESVIGARLYRGLLKTVAHVWDPTHIRNLGLQHKVLEHMKAAHRGLLRVQAALRKLDESVSREIFNSLELNSYTEISDLHTLQQLLTALERAAGSIA